MMKNNKEHGNNTKDFNIRISFFIIFKKTSAKVTMKILKKQEKKNIQTAITAFKSEMSVFV